MQISIQQQQPQMPQSQEPTKDQPVQTAKPGAQENTQNQAPDPDQAALDKYGKKLIELVSKTRDSWAWKRRGIVLKVLKNKEMLKGNHNIGFYPGTYDTFDAMEEFYNFTGTGANAKNGDRSMDQRPHNFYQMLENAFEAALSAQIPKNRHMPVNADVIEDRQTAKAASRVETIIERSNKIKGMLKQELQEIYTGGAYFKFTRYVVDSDRTGTHKETVWKMMAGEVLPARFVCFSCGQTTPESQLVAQKQLACPNCGAPFSEQNYFEDHVEEIPLAEEKEDIPSGMVLWNIYGALHIDADPDAPELIHTRLLSLNEEVSKGWLRSTFPKLWDVFQEGQSGGSSNDLQERQYRDTVTSPAGSASWFGNSQQIKPTYSRVWCQPMLFAELDDRELAQELMKQYPKGLMLAYCGEIPLQIREAKLTQEWTWCPAKKGFGLFPPPVGDPSVPIQERINDCINKIDEYMDRLACGILLANERYLDTKAMNNKALLPGVLNGIAFNSSAPVTDIQNAIFQVKAEIDAMIFNYVATLKQDMELLVGTPPQLFGAGTQDGVETASGQGMQRDQGMMKLGLTWDMVREEHADAAENAIRCAALNMTQDWTNVVTDETQEYRNEYVHLDEMKGSVHTESETDQGFPMTWAEIRDWYENLFEKGGEVLDFLMQAPENVDNALRYIGIPGLKAPGADKRDRILGIINQLIQSGPVQQESQQIDPTSGQPVSIPVEVPSVLPIKELDGKPQVLVMIENWADEHWDKLQDNKPGLDNLLAFYRVCVQYIRQSAIEQQLPAGPPASAENSSPAMA